MLTSFTCVDRYGVSREFFYRYDNDKVSREWNFFVFVELTQNSGDFFQLSVKEIDDETVRVIMMNHFGKEVYRAKGIPDALLPIIRDETEKNVVSSPTGPHSGIYRTPSATKVWKRLCKKGMAIYDNEHDIYRLK